MVFCREVVEARDIDDRHQSKVQTITERRGDEWDLYLNADDRNLSDVYQI